MAEENVIINYTGNIDDISRKVRTLQKINARVAKSLGTEFSRGLTVVSNQLDKITTTRKPIDLGAGKATNQVKQFTTVLRNANGQLVTVRETVAGTGKNIKVLNSTVTKGAKTTRGFGDNLKTLAKRAALTIPVWFALRNSIFGVFRTIRDGLGDIADFDRSLQRLRRNISATSDDVGRDFANITKEIEEFSIISGRSVQEVTDAIQKFATVGFDLETSLQAGQDAIRGAVLLFGEGTETADAFARTLRVLVDESASSAEQADQISEAIALTSQLWKNNAFTLNEFTGSLEKFAPTANTANFSIQETISLLASLSTGAVRGSRGGRLLRTSIVRLTSDVEKLAQSLGVTVNPEVDRTFDVFLRTLDALKRLRSETGKVTPEFERLAKDIFGLRSGDAVRSLIALRDVLQDNLKVLPDVGQFRDEFDNINQSTFQLVKRFQNLNKEIGRAFTVGLVGGEDFRESLEKLVELQADLIDDFKTLGFVINNTSKAVGDLISGFRIIFAFASVGTTELVGQVIKLSKEVEEVEKKLEDASLASRAFANNLKKALSGELAGAELQRVIDGIVTRLNNLRIDPEFPREVLDEALDVLSKMKEAEESITSEKEKQNKQESKTTNSESIRLQRKKAVLNVELEILKSQGATERQLARANERGLELLDIREKEKDQLERQLRTQRELNQERLSATQIGQESRKLFEIAQKEGVDVARTIGDVLAKDIDFASFVRQGGRELEVFKREFGDLFEQQRALSFFRGERIQGFQELGGGTQVQIEEQAIRGLGNLTSRLLGTELQAERIQADIDLDPVNRNSDVVNKNTNVTSRNNATIENLIRAFDAGIDISGSDAELAGRIQNVSRVRDRLSSQGVLQRVPPAQVTQNITINANATLAGKSVQENAVEFRQFLVKEIRNKQGELSKAFGEFITGSTGVPL